MAITLNTSVNLLGPEFTATGITSGFQFKGDVIGLESGGFAVAYYTSGGPVRITEWDVDANGLSTQSYDLLMSNSSPTFNGPPTIAEIDGGIMTIAYDQTADITRGFVNFGNGGFFTIFDVIAGQAELVNVTALGDNALISYGKSSGGLTSAFFQVRNNSGDIIVPETFVALGELSVTAVLSNGRFVVIYKDDGGLTTQVQGNVYAQVYEPNGTISSGGLPLFGPTNGTIDFLDAVGGLPGDRFAVVWDDGLTLLLGIYDQNGNLFASARVDSPNNMRDEDLPRVTLIEDKYLAVSWTEEFAAGDEDIKTKVFGLDGTSIDPERLLEGTVNVLEYDTSISSIGDGKFVTTYFDDAIGGGDIRAELQQIVRTYTGDGADDDFSSISGLDDNVTDIMVGNGGADILAGFGGRDELYGGAGLDRLSVRPQDIRPGEVYDGGGDTDQLIMGSDLGFSVFDFGGSIINDIELFSFQLNSSNAFTAIARFELDDFNTSGPQSFAAFNTIGTVPASVDFQIEIDLRGASSADLSQFQFQNVGDATDSVVISNIGTNGFVTGTTINDVIELGDSGGGASGGQGDDRLVGGMGTNNLNGGIGIDTMIGMDGDDVYSVGDSADVVIEQENEGTDIVFSVASSYFLADNVENGSYISSALGATLGGNELANTLNGNGRENTLIGLGGKDTLVSFGEGNTLDGGEGDDTYSIRSANNTFIESVGGGYDIINASGVASFTLPDNFERLNFTDTINHVAKGNALDNRFAGNAGNDRFLIDEGGADTFSGGSGIDVFDARASDTGVRIYLNDQTNNTGAAAGDLFASIEIFAGSNSSTSFDVMRGGDGRSRFQGGNGDDVLTGGNNIDFLRGDNGDDILNGGNQRDTLNGGRGNDTLRGGNDRDQFNFVQEDFGQDTITDYQDGLDYFKIFSTIATDLSDFTITGNGTSTVRLTLNSDTSNFIDVNGINGTDVTLTASDFQFY
ncbi:calcium-binding protein [Pseudahrensia aquimaris]|uniref:Calcium-binding protein n=1 Tax=Pseudahrensia aquimaris TaxID=744461 RepID=A0ABW3FBI6_9HYPH